MKNLFKTLVAICILTLAFHPFLNAQKNAADGAIEVQLRNIGPIINNKEVKGYYKFYAIEKIDRKNYAFLLEILDEDLNVIASRKIVESQGIVLLESAYDGKMLFLKFVETYGSANYPIYLYAFDINSELQYAYERKVSTDNEVIKYRDNIGKNNLKNNTIFGITNHGFLNYGMVENKGVRTGYTIEYFPDDTTKQGWLYHSEKKSDDYEFAEHVGANQNLVVAQIEKKSTLYGKNPAHYIAAFNSKTGDRIFEKELEDDKYKLLYVNGYIEEATDNIIILGYYHEKDVNILKDQLGLFMRVFDKKGNVISTNYVSWKEDVGKLLNLDNKGGVDSIGNVFFHDLVQTKSGKFYAIGENYRKWSPKVKANQNYVGRWPYALTENIMIFEFSPAFALEKVQIFNKGTTKTSLTASAPVNNPLQFAFYLQDYKAFDYVFTQSGNNEIDFSVGYLHKNEAESAKSKPEQVFGTITCTAGAFAMDKIKLNGENEVRVFPAKSGYVMISEYSKEAKKMDLRLEKINY